MFVINGLEIDPVLAGMVGSLLVFLLQLFFCHKVKHPTAKRIPMFTLLCGILFGLLMYCGVLGDGAAEMANQRMGFSLVVLFAIMYAGDLLGWIVYGFYRRMKQQREDMQLQ